jgi:hypothetical protein
MGGGVNQLIISYNLSRNGSQQFQLSKTKLFLKFKFVKVCTFSNRKFGVVVEVQTRIHGANGSSPGEGNFMKNVFSFVFKFGLILSNLIEIKHTKYNIFLLYEEQKIFLLPHSGIELLHSCERQLMYCQIYHSDVSVIAQFQQLSHLEILDPVIAQFQQLSHLDSRQCKCQIKH